MDINSLVIDYAVSNMGIGATQPSGLVHVSAETAPHTHLDHLVFPVEGHTPDFTASFIYEPEPDFLLHWHNKEYRVDYTAPEGLCYALAQLDATSLRVSKHELFVVLQNALEGMLDQFMPWAERVRDEPKEAGTLVYPPSLFPPSLLPPTAGAHEGYRWNVSLRGSFFTPAFPLSTDS